MSQQPTLFDLGTAPPRQAAASAPVFDDTKMIDVGRTARILGVSDSTVYRMIEAGTIANVQRGERSPYLVEYWSLVRYCDQLRVEHHIPDRRRKPSGHAPRYRDEDLLPFPLSDTMTVDDAMNALRLSKRSIHKRIEEGRFECYRLDQGSAWRISRRSFAVYAERCRLQNAAHTIEKLFRTS